MQEIAPNTYMESRFLPYNVGVIVTERGVIAIDAPPRPSHAREWLAELADTWGRPRFLVLTDAQPERLVAAALWQVPLIAAPTTAQHIAALDEKTWPELWRHVGQAFPEELEALHTLLPRRPTLIAAATLHLHYTTSPLTFELLNGSAPGSLALFSSTHKVLFAGDTVITEQPPALLHTPDFEAWQKTLSALEKRKDLRWIVPGRGSAPIPRGDLEAQREYMRTLEHTAARLARKPDTGEGLSQVVNDLQQAFYPHAPRGSIIYKTLRQGLEQLIAWKRAQRLEAAALRAAEKQAALQRAAAEESAAPDA